MWIHIGTINNLIMLWNLEAKPDWNHHLRSVGQDHPPPEYAVRSNILSFLFLFNGACLLFAQTLAFFRTFAGVSAEGLLEREAARATVHQKCCRDKNIQILHVRWIRRWSWRDHFAKDDEFAGWWWWRLSRVTHRLFNLSQVSYILSKTVWMNEVYHVCQWMII